MVGQATMKATSVQLRAPHSVTPSASRSPPIGTSMTAPHVNAQVTSVSAPTRSSTGFESTM